MKIRTVLATLTISVVCVTAHAELTPVGPFVGDINEGFDSVPTTNVNGLEFISVGTSLFGGNATLTSVAESANAQTASELALFGYNGAGPVDGDHIGLLQRPDTDNGLLINFDERINRFGGYFGEFSNNEDLTVRFARTDGWSESATFPVLAEELNWHGYAIDGGADSVEILDSETTVLTATFDGFQASYIPEPTSALLLGAAGLLLTSRRRRRTA